jgi:hypothetical protein
VFKNQTIQVNFTKQNFSQRKISLDRFDAGVNLPIAIFDNFWQFSAKKTGVFAETQCNNNHVSCQNNIIFV